MTTVAFDTIGSATRATGGRRSALGPGARRAIGWSVAFLAGAAMWTGIIAGVVALVDVVS